MSYRILTSTLWKSGLVACAALGLVGLPGGCTPVKDRSKPEARLTSGWNNYRLGEFSLALKDFQAVVQETAPATPIHLAALYGEATTWSLRRPDEDNVHAAELFHQVIDQAPTDSLAAWSWLALARIKALPVDGMPADHRQQVEAYQEVVSRFPKHLAGEEAFLMQQAAILSVPGTNGVGEVLAALRTFTRDHPDTPWLSAAYGLQGHCCAVLGLAQERVEASVKAWKSAEIDPANPIQDRSWTYWQIATLAEFETGDFDMAREYYRKLIAEYPSEQKIFLAKQELNRMDELEKRILAERPAP